MHYILTITKLHNKLKVRHFHLQVIKLHVIITFYDICINKVVLQLYRLVVALQDISHIRLYLLLGHPLKDCHRDTVQNNELSNMAIWKGGNLD